MAGMTSDDHELLDRYVRARDEAAFGEVVRRHLNLVYSAAARRVGDRHMAEDVTQAVFLILARRASSACRSGGPLSAWLLTAVRYAAANALKMERRRRRHERAAGEMVFEQGGGGIASHDPSEALAWRDVARRLDDEVLRLPALDRRAVLLRYFEQKPVRDIAVELNLTESAAKQRLSRSIDKLRRRLDRHGVTLSLDGGAALVPLLAAHAVHVAPAGLAASAASWATGAAAATASSTLIAKGAMTMMNLTKLKVAAAVVAAATVFGTGAVLTINREMARAQTAPGPSANSAVQPGGDPIREKLLARVKAAEEIVAKVNERMQAGEPMTPTFIDLLGTFHRRLADSRIELATDHESRLKAAEQYVEQSTRLLGVVKKRFDAGVEVSRIQLAQAEYYVADAECLLAKLKAAAAA